MKIGIIWIVLFFVIGSFLSARFQSGTWMIIYEITDPIKKWLGFGPMEYSPTIVPVAPGVEIITDGNGVAIGVDPGVAFQ